MEMMKAIKGDITKISDLQEIPYVLPAFDLF